jgi:hypothetical protein
MTTIDRRDLVRGAFATSFLGLAGASIALPSQAMAAPNVSRDTAIERAWFWVNNNVQYSQTATYPAPGGVRYRTDCSGFVSMCLMLPAPGPSTSYLNGYSSGISKANLKKGDFLNLPGVHCVLFQRWTNDAHTRFMLFEQSNPTSDMNHREAALSDYSSYGARRAHNIVD